MDLNKAMVIGRLTRDPESRTTPNGESVTSFSVATNFTWTNKDGDRQEKVEYHDIVAWRKLAEIVGQYLKKGSKVYIEGRLQTRSWEDQNGVKKYRTEIIAENLIMLDSRGDNTSQSNNNNNSNSNQSTNQNQDPDEEINVEDIPF